jgi:hypothetical protein
VVCGLDKTIKNETVIRKYKMLHAIGKYDGGGVNGGLIREEYQGFIV